MEELTQTDSQTTQTVGALEESASFDKGSREYKYLFKELNKIRKHCNSPEVTDIAVTKVEKQIIAGVEYVTDLILTTDQGQPLV